MDDIFTHFTHYRVKSTVARLNVDVYDIVTHLTFL